HDRVWMHRENIFGRRQAAFQAGGTCSSHSHRLDVEAIVQLLQPLLDEMGRTENGEAPDLSAIQQLAGDHSGLNGLADSHIVGDQQANGTELKRNKKRDSW